MMSIPSTTQITDVCLRVRDLDTVADFYRGVLGFKDLVSRSGEKRLSASGNEPAQILLIEDRQAAPCRLSAPGLFHSAFLFPSRHALSAALRHLVEKEIRIHGFADHGVSEAIYLADPEGNGVELYSDRPKETWVKSGNEVAMVTEPLDVDGLLRESGNGNGSTYELDARTTLGHIHLQVSHLDKAEVFYHKLLGFEVTQRSYPGALFVSAGGYHHHIGLNIWNSKNGVQAPGASGLLSFGIHVPEQKAHDAVTKRLEEQGCSVHRTENGRADVRDFDGITIRIYSSTSAAHARLQSQS